MERGDEFSRFPKLAKSNSGLGIIQHGDSSNSINNVNNIFNITDNVSNAGNIFNITDNASNAGNISDTSNTNAVSTMPPPGPVLREQDQYMPIANVIRIMRRILPPHAKISDEAKETIQECVSEFISFITGEANERCQSEQRKTVTAEDILCAMGKLGFDDYMEPLTVYLTRYRQSENERTSLRGDTFLKRGNAYGPMMMPPHGVAPFNAGFQEGTTDATSAAARAIMGGYNHGAPPGGAAGSSSQQAPFGNNLDPFDVFK
ncbi:hypothetical protein CXB51_021090 [Gossypium anomalum]|uniref:Transcription factor CBF/NF-Y/archaeal histone domain-containing protein n=1 Tax=Gossypium anomalum TaxID=47600 RepID=A0A8J5YRV2_9ROSI|nr:hypothetical protein CXB51_021090 [Gossypium anomalum]